MTGCSIYRGMPDISSVCSSPIVHSRKLGVLNGLTACQVTKSIQAKRLSDGSLYERAPSSAFEQLRRS